MNVLLYVANWPTPRIAAWNTLLKARAIENMSYVIGVNRVGEDIKMNTYPGNSAIIDCIGNNMITENTDKEITHIFTLDKSYQEKIRNKFDFLNDSDSFSLLL